MGVFDNVQVTAQRPKAITDPITGIRITVVWAIPDDVDVVEKGIIYVQDEDNTRPLLLDNVGTGGITKITAAGDSHTLDLEDSTGDGARAVGYAHVMSGMSQSIIYSNEVKGSYVGLSTLSYYEHPYYGMLRLRDIELESKLIGLIKTPLNHNSIYRGKNLTDVYTPDEIRQKITSGTFEDLYLGDYFELTLSDNTKCQLEIAHFDYYRNIGLNDPHVVFIVRYSSSGFARYANANNGTAGQTTGYYNSKIHQEILPQWVNRVESALGFNLTPFSERLSSSVDTNITSPIRALDGSARSGVVNAATWAFPKALLPNSMQATGFLLCSNPITEVGLSSQKFALFDYESFWHGAPTTPYSSTTVTSRCAWFRDVAYSGGAVGSYMGRITTMGINTNIWVRPYVIIS